MKMKSKKLKESVIREQLRRFQAGLDRERIEKLARETMAFIEKRVRDRGLRSVIDDLMDLVGIISDGVRGGVSQCLGLRFSKSRARSAISCAPSI